MPVIFNLKEFKKAQKQSLKNIDTFKGNVRPSISQALSDTGEKILEVTEENVPVVTGNLKSSGDYFNQKDLSLEAGYNTDYATKVNYQGKSRGYFTDPVNENIKNFIDFAQERFTNYFF